MFWTLSHMEGLMGAAGGSYDPPSFWFDVEKEYLKELKQNLLTLAVYHYITKHPQLISLKTNDPLRLKGK